MDDIFKKVKLYAQDDIEEKNHTFLWLLVKMIFITDISDNTAFHHLKYFKRQKLLHFFTPYLPKWSEISGPKFDAVNGHHDISKHCSPSVLSLWSYRGVMTADVTSESHALHF